MEDLIGLLIFFYLVYQVFNKRRKEEVVISREKQEPLFEPEPLPVVEVVEEVPQEEIKVAEVVAQPVKRVRRTVDLKQAVIWSEILGKPKAWQRRG